MCCMSSYARVQRYWKVLQELKYHSSFALSLRKPKDSILICSLPHQEPHVTTRDASTQTRWFSTIPPLGIPVLSQSARYRSPRSVNSSIRDAGSGVEPQTEHQMDSDAGSGTSPEDSSVERNASMDVVQYVTAADVTMPPNVQPAATGGSKQSLKQKPSKISQALRMANSADTPLTSGQWGNLRNFVEGWMLKIQPTWVLDTEITINTVKEIARRIRGVRALIGVQTDSIGIRQFIVYLQKAHQKKAAKEAAENRKMAQARMLRH